MIVVIIAKVLTDAKIGMCVVSTYNTDYVLTKKEDFRKAIFQLEKAGYRIVKTVEQH